MSTDKPAKKPRSTKTKADLEAKISELEAKLNTLDAQASKPAETRPSRRIEPPTPTVKYTGDNYYRTRRGLAYHPPDKRFTGQTAVTVQVSRPEPEPVPEPEPERAEPEPQKQKEEPRRMEPPTPTVKYTGDNYYRTRRGLAYHPPDKRFREAVAVKFEESPTVTQVESTSSSQSQSTSSSSQKRSRDEELAEYEKEYLERVQQRKAEAEKPEPAPSATKPHGTMPAGWKPS